MISEEKIISLIAEALEVAENSINLNTKSSDIAGWDSLGHLVILSKILKTIGDQPNISQELAASSSVKEILNCLNRGIEK